MIRQYTSQLSQEKNSDTLQKLGEMVLALIREADLVEGISNHEIAEALQIPTATVSGLTRPLVIQGYVRELGKRKCKITNNTVIVWTTQSPRKVLKF